MSVLGRVIQTPEPAPPKGIVYGDAGIGKSTLGGSSVNSLVVNVENGLGAIQCQQTPYLETWPEIEKFLIALGNDGHSYRVVAIDTIDWLIRRMEEHVTGCDKQITQTLNKSHGGYGNGKYVLKNYIYRCLLPHFDRIVNRGIALILLAHARRTEITDSLGVTAEKTAPDLPDDHLNTFVEWADFVCLAQIDRDGKRSLLTGSGHTNHALVKNRYGMPPVIDFTWAAIASAVSAGLAAKFPKPGPAAASA